MNINIMLVVVAKYILLLFGLFLIACGFLAAFNPEKARATIRKAGSTVFINYAELTIRMIPGIALILYADQSLWPEIFRIVGWFIFVSSCILCLVPRKLHHAYSVKSADMLSPMLLRLVAPVSMFFGGALIYGVVS